MARKNVEDIVAELALPIAEKNFYELVDVEFVKEGANWYIRVYIDKPGGITIDDCQVVSEELSSKLDEKDPVEQSYFLEVSSPGLERPLRKDRDFEKYKGEQIEVKLYQPIDGQKVFEGELLGLEDDIISIRLDDGSIMKIEREKAAVVKRAIKF